MTDTAQDNMREVARGQRNRKDDFLRTASTVIQSFIAVVITVASTMIIDSTKRLNDKMDGLMVQVAVNTANLSANNIESSIWKDRIIENSNKIDNLIAGSVEATMDRITKVEALELVADNQIRMEKWIEKYFERKK